MKKIADKLGKNLNELNFYYLGKELQPQLTLVENDIFEDSTIDVVSNQFNQNNNNINYPIKEEKPNYMNIIFKSENSMANQSNLVLNENIPTGIALLLYLIKSGRENDLFQLIQNRNSISFYYNAQRIDISNKKRIKYFFSYNSINKIDVKRH